MKNNKQNKKIQPKSKKNQQSDPLDQNSTESSEAINRQLHKSSSTVLESVNGIVVISHISTQQQADQETIEVSTELSHNKFSGLITIKSKNIENDLSDIIETPQFVHDQATATQSQIAAEAIREQNKINAEQASSKPKIIKTKNNTVITGFDTYDDIDITKLR